MRRPRRTAVMVGETFEDRVTAAGGLSGEGCIRPVIGLATLTLRADVAELVDAHGSGPCALRGVEVQVLSSALRPLAGVASRAAKPPSGVASPRSRRSGRRPVPPYCSSVLRTASGTPEAEGTRPRPGRLAEVLDPGIPRPHSGRTFSARRRVRLADVDRHGRIRLDALARFLQDVAIDDAQETGWGMPEHLWFLRRIRIDVLEPFLDVREVELVTWCSGLAAIAAGRRWSLRGDRGGSAEVDSVWIHLDPDQRPARIVGFDVYGEAGGGRRYRRSSSSPIRRPARPRRRGPCGRRMSTSTATSTTPSTGRPWSTSSRRAASIRGWGSSPSSITGSRSTSVTRSSWSPRAQAGAARRPPRGGRSQGRGAVGGPIASPQAARSPPCSGRPACG